jgi:nitrogenase molybdenum-iron protein alpha chain
MSIFTDAPEVEIRERRLNSTISYNGTGKDLNERSKAGSLKCCDRSYSQCSSCAEVAVGITNKVRDAALIYHSPIGCDAFSITNTLRYRGPAIARGQESATYNVICSNIQEKDTIFGASEKLREAVHEAHKRFSPKVIFINTSCASGIIGEDIESVADEMEEELGYPVVPIYCEGFKSKVWSSGFDALYHGVLRKLVKPAVKKQEDLINVFNFDGVDSFSPLLTRMGLKVNYLLTLASVEQLAHISEAACSTSICETLSLYGAAALEEQFGVPEIKSPPPYGIEGTDQWFRAIGKATNREELAEQVIAEEKAKYRDELENLRTQLAGKTVYIFVGDSYSHSMARIVKNLGLELIGVTSMHHDPHTDNPASFNSLNAFVEANGDIPNFSVCNIQPYQIIKILKRLKPDLLINRHLGSCMVGTTLGIPSVYEADPNFTVGYEGVVRMGQRLLQVLQTRKLLDNVIRHYSLPYTDWWLREEDPFYFEGKNT